VPDRRVNESHQTTVVKDKHIDKAFNGSERHDDRCHPRARVAAEALPQMRENPTAKELTAIQVGPRARAVGQIGYVSNKLCPRTRRHQGSHR